MRRFALLIVLAAQMAVTSAAEFRSESFEIPQHGKVSLVLPDDWVSAISQPSAQRPPTISLQPKAGPPFDMMITVIWRKGDDSTVYESALREQTQSAATEAQQQAVETQLSIKELSGTEGRGYYFTATDRAPKPGEYKHLAQGMLKLRDVALAFTILTNDGQEEVVDEALKVLASATREQSAL